VAPPQVSTTGYIGVGEVLSWALRAEDAADPSLLQDVMVWDRSDGGIVHHIMAAPGVTEIELPFPPTGIDPRSIYQAAAQAHVRLCGLDASLPDDACARYADSDDFFVEPR
jgi:hypothetical protein